MYSLGLLIVDLETARRGLLEVFEVPDGKRTNGFRTPPIPDGPRSIGLLPRVKTPIWIFSPQIPAGFLRLSQSPRNRSQGINSPLYAWAAETLQTFYRHLQKWGSRSVNLVGIETLESRLREAVVAARRRHPDKFVHGPGPDHSRNHITVSKKRLNYEHTDFSLADQRQRRLIHSESKATAG